MKIKKKEMREVEFVEKTLCDICGSDDFKDKDYDSVHIWVELSKAQSYNPESGEFYRPDICPKCFEEKLIPFLDSIGCKVKFENYDS